MRDLLQEMLTMSSQNTSAAETLMLHELLLARRSMFSVQSPMSVPAVRGPRNNMSLMHAMMNTRAGDQALGSDSLLRRMDLSNAHPQLNRNSSPHALELLRDVSLRVPDVAISAQIPSATSLPMPHFMSRSSSSAVPNKSVDGKHCIDDVRDLDILCGRGGRSNHHVGNKKYRQVVSEMKAMYRTTEAKAVKTDLSRAIVDHVCNYGGRFIKRDEKTGRYHMLSKAEARKKTSQALRETKVLKWTS